MQIKLFVATLALAISAQHGFAQLETGNTLSKAPGKDSSLSIPMPKGYIPHDPEIAAYLAAQATAGNKPKIASRKPVPIAGQKEYFGEMNEYVNDFVRQYFSSHNKTLSVVQNRSTNHFPEMQHLLKQHNIPKELVYLSVIESALDNNATSPVGAVGPWQLMEGTAKLMGIKVSPKRDDRTDWHYSTTAAAKYLSYLYDRLNDWLLVVAAYNSGPGPVVRAMQKTGSTNFWDIKKYLPRETQGHVLAFIATTGIFEKHSELIGKSIPDDLEFTPQPAAIARTSKMDSFYRNLSKSFTAEELSQMVVVRIKDVISLEYMAEELSMDLKQLKRWNKDYDVFFFGTYPDNVYNLRIPKDKLSGFLEKKTLLVGKSKQIQAEMSVKS